MDHLEPYVTSKGTPGKRIRKVRSEAIKAPCRICGLPMSGPSMGGTDVCGPCDCGMFRNGEKWDYVHAINPSEVKKRAGEIELAIKQEDK